MNRQAKKYLFDIVQTIDRIEEIFKSTPDFDSYQQNFVLRMATERLLVLLVKQCLNTTKSPMFQYSVLLHRSSVSATSLFMIMPKL